MAAAPAPKKPAPLIEKESQIPAKKPVAAEVEAATEAATEEVEDEGEPKKGGFRSKFAKTDIITLLVDYNPKRQNTAAHASFACYEDGQTVEAFLAAGGLSVSLGWDTAHGFIKIGPGFDADAEKASKPVKAVKAKKEKVEAEEEVPTEVAKPAPKGPAKPAAPAKPVARVVKGKATVDVSEEEEE